MPATNFAKQLDDSRDIILLEPELVGRFYPDGDRLGQLLPGRPPLAYAVPERWIGSSTPAVNPPSIPSGGLSRCADLGQPDSRPQLRDLIADPILGPRLLGEERFRKHGGTFRVLVKLLDAGVPIFFHVHPDDTFVAANPTVFPGQTLGKDEAYFFLDVAKGPCSYTHVGIYEGVTAKDLVAAMRKGADYVQEISPVAVQRIGEGLSVSAGLLHRPGTALTLEIQQPADANTLFQTDIGGQPLPESMLYPGFSSALEAAERVIHWDANTKPGLLDSIRLRPSPIAAMTSSSGTAEWIFPPDLLKKYSGMRLTVHKEMPLRFDQPCVLFVWRGHGTLDGREIDGGGGRPGKVDEFFLGLPAVKRGVEICNLGSEPLVAFALFAAPL